jgi:hypothetical protein
MAKLKAFVIKAKGKTNHHKYVIVLIITPCLPVRNGPSNKFGLVVIATALVDLPLRRSVQGSICYGASSFFEVQAYRLHLFARYGWQERRPFAEMILVGGRGTALSSCHMPCDTDAHTHAHGIAHWDTQDCLASKSTDCCLCYNCD